MKNVSDPVNPPLTMVDVHGPFRTFDDLLHQLNVISEETLDDTTQQK